MFFNSFMIKKFFNIVDIVHIKFVDEKIDKKFVKYIDMKFFVRNF